MSFVFRSSVVKGNKYLQVWEKVDKGEYEYCGTIGTPEMAYEKLVKLARLEKLTNSLQENLTNLQARHNIILTNLHKERK